MTTITHTTTLESLECCRCGMAIGLSKTWVDSARNTGHFRQQFWCPYCGNQQGWGESRHEKEVAALKQETERLARNVQYQEQRKREAMAEAEHFRKSRDGMKGVLVKERKRVGNGVCPCCNRTFGNLQRHMATKHPDHADTKQIGSDSCSTQ